MGEKRTRESKKDSRKSLADMKEQLRISIIEKIESGELKYISKIGNINGMPSYRTIKKIWTKDELEEIFGIKLKIHAYSNGEIIRAYYKVKELHGGVTSNLMKREAGISVDSIRNRFGSWNKFLTFLGEKPTRELKKVVHTNEDIINFYKKISEKVGKDIYGASYTDLKNHGFPYSRSVLGTRFTNMNNLRKQAGFQIRDGQTTKYTKQYLKNILLLHYKKYGRRLTQTEILKNENLPNPTVFFNYFQTTKIKKVWDEVLGEDIKDTG